MEHRWAEKRLRGRDETDSQNTKKFKSSPVSSATHRVKLAPNHSIRETNDEVHETITFCQIGWAIIASPFVQRLRELKQLGTSEKVYINTGHSRFEHSLGVAHLAEKVCLQINSVQPELPCTAKDILCIKIAGLLHDIGHGPFSHLYELFCVDIFPAYFENLPLETKRQYDNPNFPQVPKTFSHEMVSLRLIDAVLEHLGLEIDLDHLDEPLREIGDHGYEATSFKSFASDDQVLTSRDFVFIKELVNGKPIPEIGRKVGETGFVGRTDWQKEWMYGIVANDHSGLDVDKMDYYARDSRRSNVGTDRVDEVLIRNVRVAWGDCTKEHGHCPICRQNDGRRPRSHLMLCYPEKRVLNVFNFFKKRYDMHSAVYQHKAVTGASHLVCDIFKHADPWFRLKALPPKSLRQDETKHRPPLRALPISRACMHDAAILGLVDAVIYQIYNSTDERLQTAAELASRYIHRIPYDCSLNFKVNRSDPEDLKRFHLDKTEIVHQLLELSHDTKSTVDLKESDIVVEKTKIHYGRKDKNPMESIRILKKAQLSKLGNVPMDLPLAEKVDIDKYEEDMPRRFQKFLLRIYCRDKSKAALLRQVAIQWIATPVEDLQSSSISMKEEQEQYEDSPIYDDDEATGRTSTNPTYYPSIVSQSPLQSPPAFDYVCDSLPTAMSDLA